jgi:hypothetical protein
MINSVSRHSRVRSPTICFAATTAKATDLDTVYVVANYGAPSEALLSKARASSCSGPSVASGA